MVVDFLAFGRHLRVQLEGLEMQIDDQVRDVLPDLRNALLETEQADHAPGAGDVGNKVDFHGLSFLSLARAR